VGHQVRGEQRWIHLSEALRSGVRWVAEHLLQRPGGIPVELDINTDLCDKTTTVEALAKL